MKPMRTRFFFILTILFLTLFAVSFISIFFGSSDYGIKELFKAFSEDSTGANYTIFFKFRIPRLLLAISVGGSLSLAGAILQGLFRNPLVEPFTLGISGGASIGVSLAIAFNFGVTLGAFSYPLFGFLGALFISATVYILSRRQGFVKIERMLLFGVMLSFISSAFVMLIVSVSKMGNLRSIIFWIMGSLDDVNIGFIYTSLITSFVGLISVLFFAVQLNMLQLGESAATQIGVKTEKVKTILFIIAALLTGISVSIVGVIGFVGLVVPHFVRSFVGKDHRLVLVTSFFVGSIFLIIADVISRTIISPIHLPVGVITGLIGGISFLIILIKKRGLYG